MRTFAAIGVFVAGGLAGFCQNPNASSASSKDYLPPGAVQGVFQRYASSLGERVKGPGKERVTLTGTILSGGQRTPMSVVFELPGKVKLKRGNDNKTAAFDGAMGQGARGVDDDDEALLEAFVYDIAETFLLETRNGVQPRVIGYGFEVEGVVGFGSRVDIFETSQTIRSGKQLTRLAKQFLFDSSTGLLRRVSYSRIRAGVTTRVHTEYSNYMTVGGDPFPGRVIRRENGVLLYDIQWTSVQVQAKQNDNAFDGK